MTDIRELSDAELNTVTGGGLLNTVKQIAEGVRQEVDNKHTLGNVAENAMLIGAGINYPE